MNKQFTIIVFLAVILLPACAPSQVAIQNAIAGTQTSSANVQETQQAEIAQTQAAWTSTSTAIPTSIINPCSDIGWGDIVVYMSQFYQAQKNLVVGTSKAAYLLSLENYRNRINNVDVYPCTEHARQLVIMGVDNLIYSDQMIFNDADQTEYLTVIVEGMKMILDAETELHGLGLNVQFP